MPDEWITALVYWIQIESNNPVKEKVERVRPLSI